MSAQYPYGYSMAANYEQGLETAPQQAGLEAAPQNYPELAYQHQQPQQHHYGYDKPTYVDSPHPKPTPSPSSFANHTDASQYTYPSGAQPAQLPPRGKAGPRTVCGCGLLVFILSCIIALLSAAVIGLAAGTGIEAQRANDAGTQVAILSASLAAVRISATATIKGGASPTAAPLIDDGCDADPESVTGTTYTAFSLLGGLRFTRFCNKDAKFTPLMKLFTSSFSTCMDACAAYTKYIPLSLGRGENATCGAVSFVPAWTSKEGAGAAGAPGNCYLKPGLQDMTMLVTPSKGVAVHAGLWEGSNP